MFYLPGFLLVLMFSDQVKHGPDADDGHDDGDRGLRSRCFVRELIQIFALDVNKFYISTILSSGLEGAKELWVSKFHNIPHLNGELRSY